MSTSLLLLALAGTAHAQGAPAQERWDDGFTDRAPTSLSASLLVAPVLGPDDVVFTDLRVGWAGFRVPDARLTFGGMLEVQGTSAFLGDGRTPQRLRGVGPDLWMIYEGPKRRSAHSFVIRYRQPLSEATSSGWFRLSPSETSYRLAGIYDYYVVAGPARLSGDISLGFSGASIFELTTSFAAIFPVGPVALGAGLDLGLPTLVSSSLMIRGRLGDHVELGASVVFPADVLELGTTRPYPVAELKVY